MSLFPVSLIAKMQRKTALCALFCLISSALLAQDWPSFRGPNASGIAADAHPPISWNGETGANIRWKVPIPGLGHSSPVVVGNRVFVTSADSGNDDPYLRVGLYGESPDNPENEVFEYKVYCMNRQDGKLLWDRTAHKGVPKVKRHIKSTHANPTVACDGKNVLVFFGSEGLYNYSVDGELLWSKDLGLLDSGAFNAPELQWGFGSSPTIYKDKAVILADANNQSFLTVLDLKTGAEVWRVKRDEGPTWGTPTVIEHKGRTQIIVNGYNHIGAYDLKDGAEIWRLHGTGDIPTPTPVVSQDMVFITNAHGPGRPIYCISLDATGDITLADGTTSNNGVIWSHPRYGAYMPTPLVYGDYLYVGNDSGILTCFKARTGEVVYRERLGTGNAFTASPVAADGRLYFSTEEGDVYVIKAGPVFENLGISPIGGVCLATPAIAGDSIFVRTARALIAIGDTGGKVLANVIVDKPTAVKEKPSAAAGEKLAALDDKDPVSILKHVDAATKALDLVTYKVHVEGQKAAAALSGKIDMTVTSKGQNDGLPKIFKAEGKVSPPGMDISLPFSLGCDGEHFYVVNSFAKKLHSDVDSSVLGDLGRAFNQGIFVEFNYFNPFTDEINAKSKELLEAQEINGVPCYAIRVDYGQQPGSTTTWFFAKSDLLPRARLDEFTLPNGSAGAGYKAISDLVAAPKLESNWAAEPNLEGYTRTIEALKLGP